MVCDGWTSESESGPDCCQPHGIPAYQPFLLKLDIPDTVRLGLASNFRSQCNRDSRCGHPDGLDG